jgi:hypothetical protein
VLSPRPRGRAIKHRSKLSCIAEDWSVFEISGVTRGTNRGNPPIHHVTRSHDVCPGASVAYGDSSQQFNRTIVIDIESIAVLTTIPQ